MSSFDPNAILKSRVGILRLAAVGVGLFAVAFCGAGHDYQKPRDDIRSIYIAAGIDKKSIDCPDRTEEFGRCYGKWAAQLGIALIIIAWLFTIVMLIVSAVPPLSQNPQVRMADGFGHIGAGVLGILGGLLSIWWTINVWLVNNCDKTSITKDGTTYTVKPEATKACNDNVFFTPEICRPAGPGEIYVCGWKGWLWIAGGIFAIGFAVVCIVIFALAKKTGPRGPMMMGGMMTQQPSQAPMSMHPSQMTQQQQQQQNPDQQSVHPSQMTQQQG